MPENVYACPLCQSSNHSLFAKTLFLGFEVYNSQCNQCGFVFQSPRMTAEELVAFYTQTYRRVYQGEEGPASRDLAIQNGRATALLDFIKIVVPGVTRHLDIGCSAALLLKRFQDHYGCYSVGVEPGDSYRVYAQQQGFDVYADIAEVSCKKEERFDLISMAHVLEHIPDPVAYLSELHKSYLRDGGYLLVEVPNLYVHDSFEIAHMSSFSQHSLKQTLNKAGFLVMALRKHGVPRSKLLPLYITALAQRWDAEDPFPVKPEGMVSQKRKLGMFIRRIAQHLLPDLAWVRVNQ